MGNVRNQLQKNSETCRLKDEKQLELQSCVLFDRTPEAWHLPTSSQGLPVAPMLSFTSAVLYPGSSSLFKGSEITAQCIPPPPLKVFLNVFSPSPGVRRKTPRHVGELCAVPWSEGTEKTVRDTQGRLLLGSCGGWAGIS